MRSLSLWESFSSSGSDRRCHEFRPSQPVACSVTDRDGRFRNPSTSSCRKVASVSHHTASNPRVFSIGTAETSRRVCRPHWRDLHPHRRLFLPLAGAFRTVSRMPPRVSRRAAKRTQPDGADHRGQHRSRRVRDAGISGSSGELPACLPGGSSSGALGTRRWSV